MSGRTILAFLFPILLGLGGGAMFSYVFTQTIWPMVIFFSLALVAGLGLCFWARIVKPILESTTSKLEMMVSEIVTDAKYGQTEVIFMICNGQSRKVSFKSFINTKIELDAEKVSETMKLSQDTVLSRPTTKVRATFNIPPRCIDHLCRKKNQ